MIALETLHLVLLPPLLSKLLEMLLHGKLRFCVKNHQIHCS
jgi:hypothetical protein